jgi:hypothetical protein
MNFLIFFLLLFSGADKSITLEKETVIKRDFYKYTVSTSFKDKTIVYDGGNKNVLILDKNGKLQNKFGNKGNGPGEFSGGVHTILANDKVIAVIELNKVHLYTPEGKSLHDIKITSYGYQRFKITDKSVQKISYFSLTKKNFGTEIFFNGEVKETLENPLFATNKKSEKIYGQLLEFNNHFITFVQGAYRIERYKTLSEKPQIISRPFTRYKADEEYFGLRGSVPESEYQSALAYYMKLTGGFKNDIKQIYTFDQHLLVHTESDSKSKISFDLYDQEFVFKGNFTFNLKNEVVSFQIAENKLLVNLEDEDGRCFIEIYRIKVNDKKIAVN